MRKGTLLGKDFYLTEKQWSQLIGRFDVDKAKEHTDTFKIQVRCFCDELPCDECPLTVLKSSKYSGCTQAIREIIGRRIVRIFSFSMDEVYWWKEDDKRARNQVQKIYFFLMGMERVKSRNSG